MHIQKFVKPMVFLHIASERFSDFSSDISINNPAQINYGYFKCCEHKLNSIINFKIQYDEIEYDNVYYFAHVLLQAIASVFMMHGL